MLLEEFLLTSLCLNASICLQKVNNEKNKFFEAAVDAIKEETFNVTTINYSFLSGTNGIKGSGIAFEIFHAIQERYQFKYRINQHDDNEMNSFPEVLKKYANITDIFVAILPVNGRISKYLKFSIAMGSLRWHVVMKRPILSASGSGLLQPFTWEVWISIIIAVLTVGIIFFGLSVIQSKFKNNVNLKEFSLSSCLWFAYGAILKQGSTLNPTTDSMRILFATWWIFIMILTAFYTANLTAFLTLNTFTLPINSIVDIGKKGYTWCTQKNILDLLTKDPSEDLTRSLSGSTKKLTYDMDPSDILSNYVLGYNYLFLAEKPLIDIWLYKEYLDLMATQNTTSRCPYAVTEWSVFSTPFAFAYSKHFEYDVVIDRALQRLVESGLVQYWFQYLIPGADVCPTNEKVIERQLENKDLKLTYYIVGVGFVISVVLFCIELLIKFIIKKRQQRNEVFPRNPMFLVTPPPNYSTLFGPPYARKPNYEVKRKEINGRDYWCVKSKESPHVKLIPVRAPSAILYNYTKY